MPANETNDASAQAITNFFVGGKSFIETLQTVAELSVRAVPVAAFAGVTTLAGHRPRTLVHTDPIVLVLDQAQYDSGEGPGLDAVNDGEIYRIVDTAVEGPWSEFRRECVRHGIKSTMSLPMVVDDTCYGALNLYSRQPDIFGPDELRIGHHVVSQLSIVVANSHVYTTAHALANHLAAAMKHRAEVEQAKGVITATLHCTPDEAFERLVNQSQHENRKLRDIAAEVVQNASRPASWPVRGTTDPVATTQISRPEVDNMDAGERHDFWWSSLSEFRRADALSVSGALPDWMIAGLRACDIVTIEATLTVTLMPTALADFLDGKRSES